MRVRPCGSLLYTIPKPLFRDQGLLAVSNRKAFYKHESLLCRTRSSETRILMYQHDLLAMHRASGVRMWDGADACLTCVDRPRQMRCGLARARKRWSPFHPLTTERDRDPLKVGLISLHTTQHVLAQPQLTTHLCLPTRILEQHVATCAL